MSNSFRDSVRALPREPLVIFCGAAAALILGHYHGSTSFFSTHFAAQFIEHPARSSLPYFWWFGTSVGVYMLFPLLVTGVFRGNWPNAFGLGWGNAKIGLSVSAFFLAVMLPLTWVASKSSFFAGQYPLAGAAAYTLKLPQEHVSLSLFLAYEAGYCFYFISWEFLFRGWMLHGLVPHFGEAGSVLIQMLPFALMHLGKPEPEAFGSILAGLALGVLALRTKSIWYGVLVHAAVAVWMDFLSVRSYVGGL